MKRHLEYYGTLGSACQDEKTLEEMFRTGMTGVRINLSYLDVEDAGVWLEHMNRAASKCDIEPELLLDLQGPELRIGKLKKPVLLKEDKRVILGKGGIKVPKRVFPYMNKGQDILIDDGKILLKVKKSRDNLVECIVIRGGLLRSRKSMTLSGVEIPMPTLTKADMASLQELHRIGATGVMLPFVRGAQDILNVRQALQEVGASEIRIFAKIENLTGYEALDEILPLCDMVVIARGDLGNAVSLWELPGLQKDISRRCVKAGKPFMVVTQLLHSMEEALVPTRSEVLDIYNAVLDGAAALMLTGETAIGNYPSAAMGYLVQTANAALRDQSAQAVSEE